MMTPKCKSSNARNFTVVNYNFSILSLVTIDHLVVFPIYKLNFVIDKGALEKHSIYRVLYDALIQASTGDFEMNSQG